MLIFASPIREDGSLLGEMPATLMITRSLRGVGLQQEAGGQSHHTNPCQFSRFMQKSCVDLLWKAETQPTLENTLRWLTWNEDFKKEGGPDFHNQYFEELLRDQPLSVSDF